MFAFFAYTSKSTSVLGSLAVAPTRVFDVKPAPRLPEAECLVRPGAQGEQSVCRQVAGQHLYRFTGLHVYCCLSVFKYRFIGYGCTYVLVYLYTMMYRCTGVKVYRCTCVQVFRCSGVQMYRRTGVHIPGAEYEESVCRQSTGLPLTSLPADLRTLTGDQVTFDLVFR